MICAINGSSYAVISVDRNGSQQFFDLGKVCRFDQVMIESRFLSPPEILHIPITSHRHQDDALVVKLFADSFRHLIPIQACRPRSKKTMFGRRSKAVCSA